MNRVIIVLALVSMATGFFSNDGLRVKFGWPDDATENEEYFYKVPRTIKDARALRWALTKRPPGPLRQLKMYCPPGRGLCPLYDPKSEFIAGLQLSLPVDDFDSLTVMPKTFVKWTAPAAEGERARDYWTVTQFYVSAESLRAGLGPRVENGATLQQDGIWVTGLNGKLLKIPVSEAKLKTTMFKEQRCVDMMGTHYFYNMSREMSCDKELPWFALTHEGEVHGTGFFMFGTLAKQKPRHWFELPPSSRSLAEHFLSDAPDCFEEWVTNYGAVTLHIYYVDDPWNMKCEN